jgi:hypothetical protein
MSFLNIKNKFNNLWSQIDHNIVNNSRKTNTLVRYLNIPEFQKTIQVLYDSDWENIQTTIVGNYQTTTQDDYLPSYISYELKQDLNIPDVFIPFIKPLFKCKVHPEMNSAILPEYITSAWQNMNYFECKGNGSLLIYKGRYNSSYEYEYPVKNGLRSHQELLAGNFLENNTKKFWETTCYYTSGGTNYKAVGTIVSFEHDDGVSTWRCSPDPSYTPFYSDTYFSNITNSTVFGKFRILHDTETARKNFNFIDANSSFKAVGKIYEEIDGQWVKITIIDTINGGTISSIENTFNEGEPTTNDYSGYLLFWSSLHETVFRIDMTNKIPTNIPVDSFPYSYFTWKCNPIGYPIKLESLKQIQSTNVNQNIKIFKSSSGKYRFHITGRFYYLQKASKVYFTRNYDRFDDTYSIVGNTYETTIEHHSVISKKTYQPETTDIQLKSQLIFYNPLYYVENQTVNEQLY